MSRLWSAVAAAWLPLTASATPETFAIDPNHSAANFSVAHLGGYSFLYGAFGKVTGKLTLDREARTGSAEVTIDAASLNMNNPRRDALIKSADYLNVEKYPTLTYHATSMKYNGDLPSAVEGALTMFGVTKHVPLTIDNVKCGQLGGRYLCGANASGQLKRSDFGSTHGLPAVGDEIRVIIQIEAIREK